MATTYLTTSGINSLVSSYTTSEQSKLITPLNTRKTKYQNMVSAYSALSSRLDTFKTSLNELKTTGSSSVFAKTKSATLSNSSFFSVTAGTKAAAGAYSLRVSQLAKSDVTVSKQDASTAAKLANGTYTFQIKSGSTTKDVSVTIDDTVTDYSSTLKAIRDAVNSQATDIVNASAFSPDGSKSQLSITAKNSGNSNQIVLQQKDGDTSGESILNYLGYSLNSSTPRSVDRETMISDGSAGYIYADTELNAKMKFNGIDIERNTNTVSDLVDGLTFNLTAAMKDTDDAVNVSISESSSSVKSKIENFVSQFNSIYSFIKTYSATSVSTTSAGTTSSRGAFAGDATTNSLVSGLSSAAYAKVDGLTDSTINRLGDIGISFSSSSGLTISDSSKLEKAIGNNLGDVEKLFNSDNGIAAKLYNQVSKYTGTDGYLAKANESYNNNISYLAKKITSKQESIDKNASILRSKYEKLQLQLATLMTTMGSYYSDDSSSSTSS